MPEQPHQPLPPAQEVDRVLSRVPEADIRAMLRLAWDGCLSAGEIAALRWDQVDLDRGLLALADRAVPLPPSLYKELEALPRKSPLVFPSGRGGGAMNRVSVSRKCQGALLDAGEEGWSLQSLRRAGILRLVAELPIEEAARRTGSELRSLQELCRRHPEAGVPRPRRRPIAQRPAPAAAGRALEQALAAEGDTLDARVVLLSWKGGLLLRQMRTLRWEDISPRCRSWQLEGRRRPVPQALTPSLAAWRAADGGEGYVLRGVRSGEAAALPFLARRAGEFFSRHSLDGLALPRLRGGGVVCADGPSPRARLLDMAQERGEVSVRAAMELLGLSREKCAAVLESLVEDGLLRREKLGGRYLPPRRQTDWERVRDLICALPPGETFRPATLRRRLDLSPGLVGYYLNRAVGEGLAGHLGKGRYQRL